MRTENFVRNQRKTRSIVLGKLEGLHSPLSPLPTPAQNNRKDWALATHGSKCRQYVYSLQHENLLMFSSILSL